MHSSIYGDMMVYWIDDTTEWCAAYMPQQLYGYGDSQGEALLALREALRLRAAELTGYIADMHACARSARVIDLDTYRRHKGGHAIQTPEPNGTTRPH